MNTDQLIALLNEGKEIMDEYAKQNASLKKAIADFRQAFVIAVGDKSPFAKIALEKIDKAVEEAK
jgi:pyrrolidone-carboxylate peptidase